MSKKYTEDNFASNETPITDNFVELGSPNMEFEVSVEEKFVPKTKWDTKSCKVISRLGRDKAIVDFNGFGLIVALEKKDVKSVVVKYCGKIGTPDFVYEVK